MRHRNFNEKPVEGFNWSVLTSLIPWLMEYKSRVLLAILCLILAKVFNVWLPFILKNIVDQLDTTDVATGLIAAPFALIIAYGAARLTNVLLGEIRDTLFGRVTERAMRRIGLKVFDHLHKLDLSFHLERRTGGLARDIERGSTGISFLMRFMVFNIVPTFLEIILVIGLLFYNYGIYFALITLTSVAAYIAFSAITTEWRTGFIREANKADSSSNTRAIDSLLNYETVKYFNNERYESDIYDKELADWESARRKNRLSLLALNGGQALIIAIAMTSMMALAAWRVSNNEMTLGDFVLINAFMMQIFMPLNFLGFVYREIKGSLANIEQMFNLMSIIPKVDDKSNASELIATSGKVDFDNVSFHYHEDRPILKNVSFTINPGEKVAIVGESGSGKSTLVKLLFRFYDAKDGQILIDGQSISEVTQHSLRKHIGIVPQDTVLFNDTIQANIHYGRPEASLDEVMQAIKLSHLDEFIASLPDKGETMVGERGLKLSGGEKQRVAIARTILKNPPVLVFDEATSSLDSKSEKTILSSIKELSAGHTTLVIAHRLSTIADADRIVVMNKGNIVETGTHQALINSDGHYANLWRLQQQKKDDV